jgi:hypothetical protein
MHAEHEYDKMCIGIGHLFEMQHLVMSFRTPAGKRSSALFRCLTGQRKTHKGPCKILSNTR